MTIFNHWDTFPRSYARNLQREKNACDAFDHPGGAAPELAAESSPWLWGTGSTATRLQPHQHRGCGATAFQIYCGQLWRHLDNTGCIEMPNVYRGVC